VGGVHGDKREALRRFTKTVKENYWLTRRLAVENDERYYTAADAVELGEELGIPVVFDYYHHVLNPSNFDIDKLSEKPGEVPYLNFTYRLLQTKAVPSENTETT